MLAKIKTGLEYAHEDLASGISKELSSELTSISQTYAEVVSRMHEDPYIDVDEYLYKPGEEQEDVQSPKKSVRFKDFEPEADEDDTTQMRNQLMGTSGNFRPYRDSVDDGEETDSATLSSIDTTNQELFAQHQQQMIDQDRSLDSLHDSIRTQHRMGTSINDELEDHLILLNDLESGVDGSHTRLRRATNGVVEFRRKVRENGSLVTIIVLTVILILLLVVLN
ncbi:hypothetical protein JCM33374_g5035 [Metschnikowia sp. JCM 33374]|nr:hypothetical protein JCM33374_g5035 [Metschnikowia sp. JCM 33374]